MKLPKQTHGPLTLTKIDYAPNMSEETMAFTATVIIDGHRGEVVNTGRGGMTYVRGNKAADAVAK